MQSNATTHQESTTKTCPLCANEIKAEARVCRHCRAEFDVTIKGYCFHDHELVDADENGNCSVCHGELFDVHAESSLIEARPASQAVPISVSTIRSAGGEQAPIPVPLGSNVIQPEIHCHKCSTINPTTAITCQKCGTDLLPGTSVATRLGILAATIIMTIACGMGAKYLFSHPDLSHKWLVVLSISTIVIFIKGIRVAFASAPPHQRYYARAQRHLKLNPLQAIADLTEAGELAPQKEKENYILAATKLQAGIAGESVADTRTLIQVCTEALVDIATHKAKSDLLNQRAGLYAKLSMEEDSTRDLLESTYEIERAIKNGEFNISREAQNFGSFISGGGGDAYAAGANQANEKRERQKIDNQRLQLMKEGKIKAIGYCPKCKDAVVLDIDGGCEKCGRTPKHKDAIYIMPADLEQTIINVRQNRGVR